MCRLHTSLVSFVRKIEASIPRRPNGPPKYHHMIDLLVFTCCHTIAIFCPSNLRHSRFIVQADVITTYLTRRCALHLQCLCPGSSLMQRPPQMQHCPRQAGGRTLAG